MKLMKILLPVLTLLALVLYGMVQIRERLFTDTEPPVISFDSDTVTISVRDGEAALLAGVTASDRQDGDLSQSVMVRSVSQLISGNSAKVSYIVFDSADNMATAARTVVYADYQKPRFALSEPLAFSAGSTVTLQDRLSATDVIDGDLTDSIRLSSDSLNNYTPGLYKISVMVTNSMGDTATLPLTVIIRAVTTQVPVITLSQQLIYLEQGSEFHAEDYLSGLQETTEDPALHDYDEIAIRSEVDTGAAGVYEVYYTYTNELGRDTTAILTVVVE